MRPALLLFRERGGARGVPWRSSTRLGSITQGRVPWGRAGPQQEELVSSDDLTTVARFTYRHDAEYARGFLEDAGIPSQMLVDDAAGHIAFSNTAALVVRSEDAEAARKVLVDAEVELGD